jgi:hypothetical protein
LQAVTKIAVDFVTIGPVLLWSYTAWCRLLNDRLDGVTTDMGEMVAECNASVMSTIGYIWCYWAPLHLLTYSQ